MSAIQLPLPSDSGGCGSGLMTVVTVCKDDPDGLSRTVNSLREQTALKWQQVIVVSSSDPDSVTLAESLRDRRTKVLVQAPRGVYPAMNLGWREARESWIVFLNAGDIFASAEALASAQESLRDSSYRWAVFGGLVRGPRADRAVFPRESFGALDYAYGRAPALHPSVAMRRSLISALGGFNEALEIASDFELILKARIHSRPLTNTTILSVFHVGGISTRNPVRSHREMHQVRRQVLNFDFLGAPREAAYFAYHVTRSWVGQAVRHLCRA